MKKEKVMQDFEQFMQEACLRLPDLRPLEFGDSFIENLIMWAQSQKNGINHAKWLAEKINEWGDNYQNQHGVMDEEITVHLRDYFYPILRLLSGFES